MDKIFLNGFLKGFSKTLGAVTCIGLIMVSEHIYKNYKYKYDTQNIIRKCVKDIDIDTKKDNIVDVDMENVDENINMDNVYDNENNDIVDENDNMDDVDDNMDDVDENETMDIDENKYDKLYNVYLESNRFKHLFDKF
jgi:hypothetical protein